MAEATNKNQSNPDAVEAAKLAKATKVHKARKPANMGKADVAPQPANCSKASHPTRLVR